MKILPAALGKRVECESRFSPRPLKNGGVNAKSPSPFEKRGGERQVSPRPLKNGGGERQVSLALWEFAYAKAFAVSSLRGERQVSPRPLGEGLGVRGSYFRRNQECPYARASNAPLSNKLTNRPAMVWVRKQSARVPRPLPQMRWLCSGHEF